MKIIRVILSSLLALALIACMGIFILFQTYDTDQYLSQITKKASFVLGRPVSIGHVGLGLSSRGITLDVGPVSISDDPNFTTQAFVKIDRVRINLDLRDLILGRKIHIAGILLQSPQIHFIRSYEGNINIRSISPLSRPAVDNTAVIVNPVSNGITSEAKQSLKISTLGVGEFIPHNNKIAVSKIIIQDGSISFIDQNQAFPVDIWLNGINASLDDFSLSKPFRLTIDASLYSNVPNVHGSALISARDGGISFSDLGLNMDLSQVNIDRLKGISPEMSNDLIFKNIAGIVQLNMAHLDIDAAGGFTANGSISIMGGVIKNFNIIKTVLSHTLGAFGGLEGSIDNLLNGPLKDKLGMDDTLIDKVTAQFSYHDKTIFIDDSLVQTNIFELTAKGSVYPGLNVDMQTMLHLNTDVSAALINELDGLSLLCDDSKRIAIEASLKGIIPHLKYKPNKDFRKKSKKALMEEGGNILGILLGGGQTSSQDQDSSSQDQGKKRKKNFKNIFKSFLQ